jgi:proline iminopeptidase
MAITPTVRKRVTLNPGQYIANINGVELGYTVIGNGPPLIVVAPGWGIGSTYLQRGLLPLAAHFSMIFADPRGSGRSSRPLDNRAMSSALMAKDINGLIQHLMLAPVNLIAHSNGGAIATALAANHPDSCNRLVLVDSQLVGFDASEGTGKFLACARDDPRYRDAVRYTELALPRTDEAFTRHLKNLLPLYFHDPLQMVLRFLQTMDGLVSANAFHAQAAADRMVAVNQTEVLERIGADTLLLVGRHDWICPLQVSERLYSGLASSTLEIFESSGHFPWIEQPQPFFRIVKRFLKSCLSG